MKELDTLLELNKNLDRLRDKLFICLDKRYEPQNQILSDMPKCGKRTRSNVEDSIVLMETIHEDIRQLKQTLNIQWIIFLINSEEAELTEQERILLALRFYNANKWKECAMQMNVYYPNEGWNENKAFRTYKCILHKIEINNDA